jgi:hypothetical protein
MRARNAKKRHFQIETLEERIALDGTMTSNVTVTATTSTPMIGPVSSGNGNSSVSYNLGNESSTNVTVVSPPLAAATITPSNPVSYRATVVLPPVPPVVLPPGLGVSGTMVGH